LPQPDRQLRGKISSRQEIFINLFFLFVSSGKKKITRSFYFFPGKSGYTERKEKDNFFQKASPLF